MDRTLGAISRRIAWTVAAILAATLSAQAYATYSGASVGSNGTTYGWGVTDAYDYYMTHTAYVTTRLTSPKGRTAYSGGAAGDMVRADVSLPWDSTDLGTYTIISDHSYWCPFGALILMGGSTGDTTVPSVTLSLVTSGQLPMDNSARGEYNFQLGTYYLGTFRCAGYSVDCPYWATGVQIKGKVMPSTFTGQIIFKRRITKSITYDNTVEDPRYTKTDVMDGYEPAYQDQNPQSGGSGGFVYDWDAPGVGNALNAEPGHIKRKRSNYREWAELSNGMRVSSGDLLWFSRVSVYKSQSSGDLLKTDIPGDNIARVGTTKTTWNLQP